MNSNEVKLLAHYILQSKEDMRKIWIASVNQPKTSGNLLESYRVNFNLVWGEYV